MITLARYDSAYTSNTKEGYTQFIDAVGQIIGYEQHTLLDSAGGLPVYGFSIGDASKPCIVIDGSIHNRHEWKSAYGVRDMMRVISDPTLFASESDAIEQLLDKYRFYFIPIVSPDSYHQGMNLNANGVWINQNFDFEWELAPAETRGPYPFSESETRNLRDVILSENTAMYINGHTVGSLDDLFMIRAHRVPAVNRVVNFTAQSLEDVYSDYGKKSRLNGTLLEPSSYNWAGEQAGAGGRKIVATVFEPGAGLNLQQLCSVSVHGMLTFIANIDDLGEFADDEKRGKFFFDLSYFRE